MEVSEFFEETDVVEGKGRERARNSPAKMHTPHELAPKTLFALSLCTGQRPHTPRYAHARPSVRQGILPHLRAAETRAGLVCGEDGRLAHVHY